MMEDYGAMIRNVFDMGSVRDAKPGTVLWKKR